jgi:hypothetical protein
MTMHPQQSFEHTLREISVNREDPCELVRELISNSYDAGARNIHVIPLYEQKGLIFFDDGCGLSQSPEAVVNGVLPYVAFFSIGKGTKTQGEQIGYKCQGSKLCFASRRFSLITRCIGEKDWRCVSIRDPKKVLNENLDITPSHTSAPWDVLEDDILGAGDSRTKQVVTQLPQNFFTANFKSGLMVVIEGFEVDNFDYYFSASTDPSYLREYIRFYTAHADVRRIGRKESGFRTSDINQLRKHVSPAEPCVLHLWTSTDNGSFELKALPAGWPYLPMPQKGTEDSAAQSPEVVPRLRDGTFYARYADSFKYENQFYNIILAIDGKRRALNSYSELSRQSAPRSGIRFTDQRGVILCSQGVRVCQYPQLLEHDSMNGWKYLAKGVDHFVLFIDGPFDLVTNRNLPAQGATTILKQPAFVKQIADFLTRTSRESGGDVLRQLLHRINREATAEKENEYISKTQQLKEGVEYRAQFRVDVTGSPATSEKWFIAPLPGEEHFVGALYTLFAHLVPNDSDLKEYWHRPLTFKSLGIDALGMSDESQYLSERQLECIEYKYMFSAAEDFNHPLTITDRIVCWSLEGHAAGETVEDTFGYQATVGADITAHKTKVGFSLTDIRHRSGGKERQHEIKVVSLRHLLDATFKVQWRNPPQNKENKGGRKKK